MFDMELEVEGPIWW